MVSSARAALLTVAVLGLGACGPEAATVPARPSAGRGTGGAGSVTVSVTKPVVVAGHVDTTVSCATSNRVYTASADSAAVAGYHVAFTVRVAPYHGPGEYPAALVSLTLDGPTGTIGSGSGPAPATVTASGGSFTLDTTTGNDQSFAAHLAWACSAGSAK